ncbi:DUF1643 domain-containing protein, partial [Micromonospora sp. RV43]|uniref:DUF1643 domain-containing protein n=1 Tax=Micromonospora sp. RV43 TaxID=1661387 RepID=UPI00064BB994
MHTDLVTDQHAATLDEQATATFSPCRTYRYALTRRWHPDRPLTVFVMCNPSTADAFRVDPTVARCIARARTWGTGGLLVLNLFALRSTDPKALYGHPDPVGPDNDRVIAEHFTLAADPLGLVVAAWGTHGALHDRSRHVDALLRARGVRPLCLGVTRAGFPRHP